MTSQPRLRGKAPASSPPFERLRADFDQAAAALLARAVGQALPLDEFRREAEALAACFEETAWTLQRSDPALAGFAAFRRHLRAGVAALQEEYLAHLRPATPLAAVFANAAASSPRHLAGGVPARATTIRCRSCGSPRAAETETLCRYCGQAVL
ncbi:hypothetical protein [Chitinilyticum aquatile]|uniref:hypothetical protein n=1 Tax=Chitinilyticum aquatile TaxID=362520 RepID=UPI000410AEBE|nr:hypothetical protein [Chitinilyticum aquatile]